ncbi:MAG: metalloregulator ArsR/SmtB family transcription factor [Deltaproteobacteria bacterium]|nr:metalloregulator ArsR/SmtB family transcription factor [Deltaproteobacteria bacterium]
MRQFMNVAKALNDENRVRVLLALRAGELCVCQIIELLGLAPSTVSKHMSILKQAGLVNIRKSGRLVFYRLATASTSPEVKGAITWLNECLLDDSFISQNENRLRDVLKWDIETLCSRCKVITKTKAGGR